MSADPTPVASTDDEPADSPVDADDEAPRRARFAGFGFPDEQYGPLIAAVMLAWVSTPFAALSILGSSVSTVTTPGTLVPLTFIQALAMAFVAVTAAALAAGAFAGAFVRRRPVLGLSIALFLAWPIAIATLPVLPALLGWPYRAAMLCISACSPMLSGDAPLSGLAAYGQSLLADLAGPLEVAGVLAVIAIVLARSHRRLLASAFVIAAFVSLNFWSILWGAWIAAAALVVGAVVWVAPYWMGEADEGTRS